MNPMFSESAAFALQRLTDLGWSPVAAQGMVGNLIQESGRNLNPTALHDGGTGFGIAGFRDPRPGEGRWTNLRRFSRERGLDHRTLDAQLQFIDHELRTSERGVGNRLKQARDPAEAARVAIDFFRPAGWTSRNPTGGHGWKNRLQNTMTLAGAPMPTNRIAMDQVQQASAAPPMLPPPRPGGLGGLGGTEPPAAYASMSDMPASGAHAAQGGDPNQTVPMALAALNAGDDRAPRADAFGQTIPSLRQAGVDPRQPFTGRASGLDSFGPGGPQPFAANQGPAAIGPRGGGVAAMQANPMQAPAPNMTPRSITSPGFMRPILENSDGSFSTEETITVGFDDGVYNIPTIVDGRRVDEETAIRLFLEGVNQPVGRFSTEQEAIAAARARSNQIGVDRSSDRMHTPRPDAPPSFMRAPQSQAQGVPSFVQGAPPPIQYGGPSMVPDAMPARPVTPNVNAIAGMPSPQQQPPMPAPQPNTGGQPMPRGIDPNQYAGGEWIPPEIGRQLAAQQMSGQANMPAQGAMPAQGGGGGMPAPQGAPGGLGGLGGLRGPLHAMFLSMLSSTDRRAPFANMPAFMQQQMQMEQQMQAQQQAEADRLHDQQLLFGGGGGGGGQASQAAPGPDGQQGEAPAATPASFATGNRTVDGLLARRADITNRMMMARTDEARKALEAQRNQIDAEISQRSPTPDMKQYAFDMDQRQQVGEPPILYRDWDAQRAAARRNEVNVDARNLGNIPPGWQVMTDPETGAIRMEELAGGPVERERLESERQAAARTRATQQAGGTVVQDLGRALNLAPNMVRGEGVVGANARLALARVPGTTEYTINSFKESALSNIGLDTLQRMRENSPTGGALGQVPIQQQARLEQVLGSLDLGQSPEIIEDNMKRVMNIYTDIMFGDAGERALAVEEGRMTQQEADRISAMYYELSFDERGNPIDRSQSGSQGDVPPPPQGVEPEVWQFMTPKERALWN